MVRYNLSWTFFAACRMDAFAQILFLSFDRSDESVCLGFFVLVERFREIFYVCVLI